MKTFRQAVRLTLLLYGIALALCPALSIYAQNTVPTRKELWRVRNGTARVLAWSPDGKMLAIGGSLGIWLYTPDLKPIVNFDGNDDEIRALAWSPTGRQIATVSSAYAVQLWDTTSGKVQTLKQAGSITCKRYDMMCGSSVTFSPDGSRLASATSDSTIYIWDTLTTKLITTLKMAGPIYTVAWQSNGSWLAVGGYQPAKRESPYNDMLLQIWDTKSSRIVSDFVFNNDPAEFGNWPISYLQWYNGGKSILVISGGRMGGVGDIFSWNVETGKGEDLQDFHIGAGNLMSFSPDGKSYVVTGSGGLPDLMIVTPANQTIFLSTTDDIRDVTWKPDSRYLAVITGDGTLHILDSSIYSEAHAPSVATTHDFDDLPNVWWSADGTQILFNAATRCTYAPNCLPFEIKTTNFLTGNIEQIHEWDRGIGYWEFNKNGTAYVSVSMASEVGIFDAATDQPLVMFNPPSDKSGRGGPEIRFTSFHWSPDNTRVAGIDRFAGDFSREDGFVVWEAETGRVLVTKTTKRTWGEAVFAWSPGSRLIALLRLFPGGEQIEIIDSTTGETIRLLDGFIGGAIKTFHWSPDGTRIVGQSELGKDSRIHIWNAATGKLIQSVAGETFTLINGGAAIAVYTRGQPFKIYDTITGRLKATFKGDLKDAYQIVFSPDSRRVASAHRDKTIRVWNVATGKLLLILTGHHFLTAEMLWKPDGTQLLTRGDDDTWKLWNVTLGTEI